MTTRLLLLPQDKDDALVEAVLDPAGNAVLRRFEPGSGRPPAIDPAARTLVAVPGIDVRTFWLQVPVRPQAQAIAAARIQLQGRVGADPGRLHVAIGDGPVDALRPVAVVAEDTMREWMDRCAAAGVAADALVPDYLMLPSAVDAAPTLASLDGRWLVRGPAMGFSAEPELVQALLADELMEAGTPAVPEGDTIRMMLEAVGQPAAVDLLQGRFAPRSAAATRHGRRLALLAAAVLLMPLVAAAAQALHHGWRAHSAQTRMADEARRHGFDAGPDEALAAYHRLTAPDRFAMQSAPVFAALAQNPELRLDSLAFDSGAGLDLQLLHADAGALERFQAELAASEFQARIVDSGQTADGWRTRLLLEPRSLSDLGPAGLQIRLRGPYSRRFLARSATTDRRTDDDLSSRSRVFASNAKFRQVPGA